MLKKNFKVQRYKGDTFVSPTLSCSHPFPFPEAINGKFFSSLSFCLSLIYLPLNPFPPFQTNDSFIMYIVLYFVFFFHTIAFLEIAPYLCILAVPLFFFMALQQPIARMYHNLLHQAPESWPIRLSPACYSNPFMNNFVDTLFWIFVE